MDSKLSFHTENNQYFYLQKKKVLFKNVLFNKVTGFTYQFSTSNLVARKLNEIFN